MATRTWNGGGDGTTLTDGMNYDGAAALSDNVETNSYSAFIVNGNVASKYPEGGGFSVHGSVEGANDYNYIVESPGATIDGGMTVIPANGMGAEDAGGILYPGPIFGDTVDLWGYVATWPSGYRGCTALTSTRGGSYVLLGGDITVFSPSGDPVIAVPLHIQPFSYCQMSGNYSSDIVVESGATLSNLNIMFTSGGNVILQDGGLIDLCSFADFSRIIADGDYWYNKSLMTDCVAKNILQGKTIADTLGTRVDCPVAKAITTSGNYGDPDIPLVGTYVAPTDTNVRRNIPNGVSPGIGLAYIPAAADVRRGTNVDATTGLAYIPAAADVRRGTNVDATTGLAYIPAAANVRFGTNVDATTGLCKVPVAADVKLDVPVDVSDTGKYDPGTTTWSWSNGRWHINSSTWYWNNGWINY
jgi:hypothetical protein